MYRLHGPPTENAVFVAAWSHSSVLRICKCIRYNAGLIAHRYHILRLEICDGKVTARSSSPVPGLFSFSRVLIFSFLGVVLQCFEMMERSSKI